MDKEVSEKVKAPTELASSGASCHEVIIVGAGAAGLTAGYDLNRKGCRIQVLEANTCIGGRLRKLEGFAGFPIDLGGQWIHTDPKILKTIVDDPSVEIQVKTQPYNFNPFREWKDGKWSTDVVHSEFHKFIGYTWFDFFQDYIAESIKDCVQFGCVVRSINYSGEKIKVECHDGRIFEGNQIIVTVGLKILQDCDIIFNPPLPDEKRKAIENAPFEPGLKVFFEFTDCFFFKDFDMYQDSRHGERYFWEESWNEDSHQTVLGVFMYGEKSLKYTELDDDEIAKAILNELDDRFEGRASESYVKHVVQNWTRNEPFVRGLYSSYRKVGMKPLYTIMQPVDKKLFFAGEALPVDGGGYGYVHAAALSGRNAATVVKRVRDGKNIPFNCSAWLIHLLSTVLCGLEHRLWFRDIDD